jgi:hypothetical protein
MVAAVGDEEAVAVGGRVGVRVAARVTVALITRVEVRLGVGCTVGDRVATGAVGSGVRVRMPVSGATTAGDPPAG